MTQNLSGLRPEYRKMSKNCLDPRIIIQKRRDSAMLKQNMPKVTIIPYTIKEALRKSVILPPLPPPEPEKPCRCRELWKPKKKKKKKKIRVIPQHILERRMLKKYVKEYPLNIYPSNPCRYFPRKLEHFLNEIKECPCLGLERIFQIEENNHLYLKYAILAKAIGAWDVVKAACCPFCPCDYCCACNSQDYKPRDPERELNRQDDMYSFKQRVKHTYYRKYVNMYKILDDPWPLKKYNLMYHPSLVIKTPPLRTESWGTIETDDSV